MKIFQKTIHFFPLILLCFFCQSVFSQLVINEFLASNDSIAADQDEEYDDWVELFNNGNDAIDLTGYYLSDSKNNLKKWQFPSASIEGQGYLIVWADGDEDQEGLHSSFKLSAGGESLILSLPDSTVIDSLSFGDQLTDISTGRIPNGTGDFISLPPSFNAENQIIINNTNDLENANISSIKVGPNPFSDQTQIQYTLGHQTNLKIQIYDNTGKLIFNFLNIPKSKGKHIVTWDGIGDQGGEVSDGQYLCVFEIEGFRTVENIIKI